MTPTGTDNDSVNEVAALITAVVGAATSIVTLTGGLGPGVSRMLDVHKSLTIAGIAGVALSIAIAGIATNFAAKTLVRKRGIKTSLAVMFVAVGLLAGSAIDADTHHRRTVTVSATVTGTPVALQVVITASDLNPNDDLQISTSPDVYHGDAHPDGSGNINATFTAPLAQLSGSTTIAVMASLTGGTLTSGTSTCPSDTPHQSCVIVATG